MNSDKITLLKDGSLISNDKDIAETFNNFIKETEHLLEINENNCLLTNSSDLSDPVAIALRKYSHHPSVRNIKNFVDQNAKFSFSLVEKKDVEEEINKLNTGKSSAFSDIP